MQNPGKSLQLKTFVPSLVVALVALAAASGGHAQRTPFDRLSADQFDVVPPSDSVIGEPGRMRVRSASCQMLQISDVRRRIVDVAVQEWAFFGFSTVDQTQETPSQPGARGTGRRRSRLSPEQSARVADSIAGSWAATPDGSWIVDRQNDRWNGPSGVSSRWRDPWSAAFVSWVMCEGGLGERSQFARAIAHVTYIDQAIRSRDGGAPRAAFTAYDAGETEVGPGDLLCTGSRPNYRTIAERRRQLGVGARTHCDVVVRVDEELEQILTIGGNVRGTVSMKLLPAVLDGEHLSPIARGGRPVFAHLKLNADPIAPDAMDTSPTIQAIGCTPGLEGPIQLAASTSLTIEPAPLNQC
jgi:hypothetical protein